MWLWNGLACFGLLLAFVLVSPFTVWSGYALAHPWQRAQSGTVVAFAGQGVTGGGFTALDDSSYWRSVYTVRLWRRGGLSKVILIGAPAANQMQAYLRAFGINEVEIAPALDAGGAARYLAAHPGFPAPLNVLSSDFQTRRIARAFHQAGLNPVIESFPDAIKRGQPQSWYKRLTVFGMLLGEAREALR